MILAELSPIEIVFGSITTVCVIVTAIIAWVALNRRAAVDVSFSGVPVDKEDYDKDCEGFSQSINAVHAKIGAAERGVENRLRVQLDKVELDGKQSRAKLHDEINQANRSIAAVQATTDASSARITHLELKTDRIVERMNE